MKYLQIYAKSRDFYHLKTDQIDYLCKYFLKLTEEDKETNCDIDEKTIDAYFAKALLVSEGKPLQYVVGDVDFFGYSFKVNENVLIPRFETEELVDATKNLIKKYFPGNICVLDIGTGSGVIGLTLKKEVPVLDVTMVDISEDALDVAKANAKELAADVKIYHSDMLNEVCKDNKKYDVLISNPPYIREDEEIMDIVLQNEPHLALYGGSDGLHFYREILKDAHKVITDKALIAFEIGMEQGEKITQIAQEYFPTSEIEIRKDLAGKDRMFFLFYDKSK